MASAGRAPQALTKNLSSAARPHYVCRACRIVQREAQQLRHRSGLSSGHRSRSATSTSIEQRRPISIPSLFRRTQKPQEPQEDALQEAEEDPNAVPMEPYVEATTWDGLEHMGHQRHWKDLPPDAKDDYEPWLDPATVAPPQRDQFLGQLYMSIVECFVLKGRGEDPNSVLTDSPLDIGWGVSFRKIQLSSRGTISHLEDLEQDPVEKFGSELTDEEIDADEPPERPAEVSDPQLEEGLRDARFDFRDPITFTILKRFSQRIHHRIPDPLLNTVMRGNKDLVEFIDLLAQTAKHKPKKFADVLLAKQQKAVDFAAHEKLLAEQNPAAAVIDDATRTQITKKQKSKLQPFGPNVMIISRKLTQQDREIEVGRWKVIKKELESRGLPVYALPGHVPDGETWLADDGERALGEDTQAEMRSRQSLNRQ